MATIKQRRGDSLLTDVFCTGEILDQAYYGTDHMLVVYNKYPAVPGHSLIIPKRHVESTVEMTEREYADMLAAVKKVVPVLLELYGTGRSYDLIMQIGPYSGMSINHLHMHVLPRNKKDKYQVDTAQLYGDIESGKIGSKEGEVARETRRLRKIFKYVPRSKR